tara:strand:+ start:349 stop:480 length:132 start_codon:yes stop_codon:yes gene_type:complete
MVGLMVRGMEFFPEAAVDHTAVKVAQGPQVNFGCTMYRGELND